MDIAEHKEYLKVISRALGINHNIETLVTIAGRPFLRILYFISYLFIVEIYDEGIQKQKSRKKQIKYRFKNYKETIEHAYDKLSCKELKVMITNPDFQEQIIILLKKHLDSLLTDDDTPAAERLNMIDSIRINLALFKKIYSLHFPNPDNPGLSLYDKMILTTDSYITYLRRKEKLSLSEYQEIHHDSASLVHKTIRRYNKEIKKKIPHVIYKPEEKPTPYREYSPKYEEMKQILRKELALTISNENIIDVVKKLRSINDIVTQELYDIMLEIGLDWLIYCPDCEKKIDVFPVDFSFRIAEVFKALKPGQQKPFIKALAGLIREVMLFAIHSDTRFSQGWRYRLFDDFLKEIKRFSFRMGDQDFINQNEMEYLSEELKELNRQALSPKKPSFPDFDSLFYEPHIIPRLTEYLQTQEGGYYVGKNGKWIKSAAELIGFSISLEINSYIHNGIKKTDLCQLFSEKFQFPVKPVTWRKKVNYKRDDAIEAFNQILKDFKLKLEAQNN